MPVIGINPIVIPIFSNICAKNIAHIPIINIWLNLFAVFLESLTNLYNIIVYNPIKIVPPTNPISSTKTGKI